MSNPMRWHALAARIFLLASPLLALPDTNAFATTGASALCVPAVRNDYGVGDGPRGVAIADLDGDGDADVAVANGQASSCSIFRNVGMGHLELAGTPATGPFPYSVDAADLDHDGRMDLVVGHFGGAAVHLGNGDMTFQPMAQFPMWGSVHIVLADMNGDGHADIAAAGFDASAALIALGNGDGTFGDPVAYGSFGHPISIAIADLNGDGSPDVVCGRDATFPGELVNSVAVLLGNGDGSLGSQADIITGNRPRQVALGDLNADGHPDLVVSNFGAGNVSVLLGNGDGTFSAKQDHPAGSSPEAIAIADMNRDGHADVAVNNVNDPGTTALLLGAGDGSFLCQDAIEVGSVPTAIACRVLAGASQAGLVVANEGSNSVSVVLLGSPVLEVQLDLDPNVINLASHAPWLTAYIETSGFIPSDIDVSSLLLAGTLPALSKFATIGDHNANGVPDLMVKFSRVALDPLLIPGANELALTGSLVTGEEFEGQDEVQVIRQPDAPLAASVIPNPINPSGVLRFQTSKPGPVRVRVFDAQGRLVRVLMDMRSLAAGTHTVPVDGRGERGQVLVTGVYFYRIETDEGSVAGRIAILK